MKKNSNLKWFNRFACFWPKGYQRRSLGKSHQNGDYLKQALRKNCLPTGIEPAAFGLPKKNLGGEYEIQNNPKAADLTPVGRQFFRNACFK